MGEADRDSPPDRLPKSVSGRSSTWITYSKRTPGFRATSNVKVRFLCSALGMARTMPQSERVDRRTRCHRIGWQTADPLSRHVRRSETPRSSALRMATRRAVARPAATRPRYFV